LIPKTTNTKLKDITSYSIKRSLVAETVLPAFVLLSEKFPSVAVAYTAEEVDFP